jgi:hypothetical protein
MSFSYAFLLVLCHLAIAEQEIYVCGTKRMSLGFVGIAPVPPLSNSTLSGASRHQERKTSIPTKMNNLKQVLNANH